MMPARNMMDDYDLSGASYISTIVNFVMALLKATNCVNVDAIKKFTGRNFLSISSR